MLNASLFIYSLFICIVLEVLHCQVYHFVLRLFNYVYCYSAICHTESFLRALIMSKVSFFHNIMYCLVICFILLKTVTLSSLPLCVMCHLCIMLITYGTLSFTVTRILCSHFICAFPYYGYYAVYHYFAMCSTTTSE